MKKLLLLSCFVLLAGLVLNAQENDNPPVVKHSSQNKSYKSVMCGIKVSPNLGWFIPDTKGFKSEGVVFGFSWGFMADFAFSKNYALATGFNVIASNGKMSYSDHDSVNNVWVAGNRSRTYKLRYLEIPLTLKMRTRDFGKFTFYGQIGLGTGFRIRAKASDEFTDNNNNTLTEEDNIKDDIFLLRESLLLGIGTEFSLGGSTKLIAGFDYNGNLIDPVKDNSTIKVDTKQYLVGFTVGILF